MFLKCVLTILALTGISAGLLELRHEKLEMIHQMASMHREVEGQRRSMWDAQARIAQLVQPSRLEQVIASQRLALESLATPVLPATEFASAEGKAQASDARSGAKPRGESSANRQIASSRESAERRRIPR